MNTKTRNTKAAKKTRRALTLVECLAVVALLAVAVATIAAGLSPSVAGARLREVRSIVLDLDARARVLTTRSGPVVLRVSEGRASVHLGDVPLFVRHLSRPVEAVLTDPGTGTPLDAVRIDTRGRSPDYALLLRSDDRHTLTLVSGLTGYAFEGADP